MEREAEQQRETEVGDFLRAHRLQAGLSLSEASNALCIREAYLKAIEDGRFGDLPGPTYVAGFIRTYSEHLGLDGNEVVRQLKAEPMSMDSSSELRFPSPMSEGGMPSGAILLIGVFVALVAYGAWYVGSSRDESIAELISPLPERLVAFLRDGNGVADTEGSVQRQSAPESPPIRQTTSAGGPAADDQASPSKSKGHGQTTRGAGNPPDPASSSSTTDTRDQGSSADSATASRESSRINNNSETTEVQVSIATPPASEGTDTQPTRQPTSDSEQPRPEDAAALAGVRIVLRAKGENWVEIREENTDRLVIARLFKPGDTFDVPNTPALKLLTGNAGGLEILVDGEPVPPLGVEGMVRRNIPLDAEQLRSGALARN